MEERKEDGEKRKRRGREEGKEWKTRPVSFWRPEASLTTPGFLRAEFLPGKPGSRTAYVVGSAHPAQPTRRGLARRGAGCRTNRNRS